MRRIILMVAVCLAGGCASAPSPGSRDAWAPPAREASAATPVEAAAGHADSGDRTSPSAGPRTLLGGRDLAGWRVPGEMAFRRHGEVRWADGVVRLGLGKPLTAIAWAGEFPRSNYEVQVQAQRSAGGDFFCGMTFPVGRSHCTWIVGGWGGQVVGLSNVDGKSAAQNATTRRMTFETGRWYRLRLRVTSERIACFIDGEAVIDQARGGHAFAIWPQQEPCRPFGIATYLTGSAIRSVTLRRLGE